ncbi:MAG: adenylate kinase [Bacilli bacterium]|nr:adenylate kinase [Bacilli bacterium]
MNIILIAPPAGGKGTQSELICSKYNIKHISTGDLLRKEVENGNTELKNIMDAGMLVSDEIIFDLIRKCISSEDSKNGYLLDGFPRNIEQAKKYDEILEELNIDIGKVILLDIDPELAAKRIAGRRSCMNCGSTYNIYFDNMKPTEEGICNNCNTALTARDDDNEETYKTRYNTYLEKTQPLIDYYKEKNVLYTVDANGTVDETFNKIEDIVRGD